MSNNKGGRPKKNLSEKRSVAIKFSCTPSENRFIEEQAAAAGFKQVALFLHDFFVKTVSEGKFVFVKQNEVNRQYVNELAAIGSNINQLTHMLHCVSINSHPLLERINDNLGLMAQVIMLTAARAQEGTEEPASFENNNKNMEAENGNA